MAKRTSSPVNPAHRFVVSGLLAGYDWFDQGVQNVLASRGLPTLNRTQSMVMLYITAGVQRPSEIARRMRFSRQAMWYQSRRLVELGLIDIIDDRDHKGGRRLVLREGDQSLFSDASNLVLDLEQMLAKRIGGENVEALRGLLHSDWGPIAERDSSE